AIAAPVVFFYMYQAMQSTLPFSIVEAARIDGCHEVGIFNRIVLHMMKPASAVQAIFSVVGSWNNYFVPALVINSKEKKTIPIMIAQLRSADYQKFDMGQVYMTICIAIIPLMIVYLCLSRFIIKGVSLGAVKE
ncbi:MAG: carbohydrate ABC transporter permease, partial [Treponema sp.]|nr:carbohydrate ABC transporter permease [Treponema sp.]